MSVCYLVSDIIEVLKDSFVVGGRLQTEDMKVDVGFT